MIDNNINNDDKKVIYEAIYNCALRTVDNECNDKFISLLPALEQLSIKYKKLEDSSNLSDSNLKTKDLIFKLILTNRIDEFMSVTLDEIVQDLNKN